MDCECIAFLYHILCMTAELTEILIDELFCTSAASFRLSQSHNSKVPSMIEIITQTIGLPDALFIFMFCWTALCSYEKQNNMKLLSFIGPLSKLTIGVIGFTAIATSINKVVQLPTPLRERCDPVRFYARSLRAFMKVEDRSCLFSSAFS